MPSIKSLTKPYEKWTANDVYIFWCKEYEKHQDEEYTPFLYKQRELSVIKQLIEDYEIYTILINIQYLLETASCTSISYLANDISEDISSEPKLCFYVNRFGGQQQRELMNELDLVDSMWFQTPAETKRREEIKNTLEGWIVTIK